MSRLFTGGAFNYITFAPGGAPQTQGPITLAVLVKPATIIGTHWWWVGRATSTHVWSVLTDTSHLFMENDFAGGPIPTVGNWWWVVVTKASGNALPRWHLKNLTTGAAWTHANEASGTVPNNGSSINNITFGGDGSNTNTNYDGKGAAAAAWSLVLSDAAIEAACTLNASDLLAAAPGWMIRLNQASTATPVIDDTGNGGDQTAITGTAVDAEDPPGFSYTLSSTTPFSKSVVERYQVLGAWTKSVAEQYRVLAVWSISAPETYRVLGSWSLAVSDYYRVLNGWTLDKAESYRVLGTWTRDVAEQYRVLNGWSNDVIERYDVLSGTAFSAEWAESYRILGVWSKEVVERYGILGVSWMLSVTERYRLYAAWTRSVIERYTVGEIAPPQHFPAATANLTLTAQARLVGPAVTAYLEMQG